jgi:P27 family predicted phage terminase small subunit
MGKRGPAPTPTELLKLRGSWRGNRNTSQPRPQLGRPRCPAWLDAAARSKWKRLAPELERLGLLTIIDGDILAMYCQAWAEFQQSTKTLQAEGRFVRLASGKILTHPAVAEQRSARQAVKSFAALFGLSPADRSRLSAPTPAEPDDLDLFFGEPGESK